MAYLCVKGVEVDVRDLDEFDRFARTVSPRRTQRGNVDQNAALEVTEGGSLDGVRLAEGKEVAHICCVQHALGKNLGADDGDESAELKITEVLALADQAAHKVGELGFCGDNYARYRTDGIPMGERTRALREFRVDLHRVQTSGSARTGAAPYRGESGGTYREKDGEEGKQIHLVLWPGFNFVCGKMRRRI